MKNLTLRLFISLLALSVAFVSCEKDDEDELDKNEGVYDGENFELGSGILEYYGLWNEDPATYNFDITLFSNDITFDSENYQFSGKGTILYFEMFSSSESELLDGTYTFDPNESGDANTFDMGEIYTDFDMATETGTIKSFKSGTVEIEKSGSTYKIKIDGKDNTDKTITASYEGTLAYEDWSLDFKSTKVKKKGILK
jgi:hypothetical protein